VRSLADAIFAMWSKRAGIADVSSHSYVEGMAASDRLRRILSEVRELSAEEKAELETELLAEDAGAGAAWGEEIDRRAQRVLGGEATGLSRTEVRSLFAMSPADARARLTQLLDARK
jgi:hypothetical protein